MTDWEKWRADYRSLSFDDQRRFYNAVGLAHPDQRCYDAKSVRAFLAENEPSAVIEVGGWNGELADEMLKQFPGIFSWLNYEICESIPVVCSDNRYYPHKMDRFPWEADLDGDCLILSHVVEHMLLEEFGRMIGRFTGSSIYIESPIGPGPTSWVGYDGSHIIEGGWDAIGQQIPAFSCTYSYEEVRWYKRNQ